MVGGWGPRAAVLCALLGGGCVSIAQHQAKVEELERLRSDVQRSERQWIDRLDRQSAKLGELQQQLTQSDTRLSEQARSIQQVHDLSVQLDQRLTMMQGRPCSAVSTTEPHSVEPSAPHRPTVRFDSKAPRSP